MTYRLDARAHRQQQVVDYLQAAHQSGRPGVPLPELRRELRLTGWAVLDRLCARALIGCDDGLIYLRATRPLPFEPLPPNVVRLRRPAPSRPAPVDPPPPAPPPAA